MDPTTSGRAPLAPSPPPNPGRSPDFVHKLLWSAVVFSAMAVAAAVVWVAAEVLLMTFAAILGAVALRGLSDAVAGRSGLSEGWSLALTTLALTAAVAGLFALIGGMVANEAGELPGYVSHSVDQTRQWLAARGWGAALARFTPDGAELLSAGDAFNRVGGLFSKTLGVAANLIFVATLTVYLAASPGPYVEGLLRLFPLARRPRVRRVLEEVGRRLRGWVLSRLAAMAVVAVLSALGLWLLGVPYWLSLGLLSGLLTAVPTFGPIAAAVPAVLVGLLEGPFVGLTVILLYVGVQAIDNNVLTPLLQQRAADLPAALAMPGLMLAAALFGWPGLILGAPVTLAAMILVQRFYVEDVLGDRPPAPEVQGERHTTV